jgi:hypothetical protein
MTKKELRRYGVESQRLYSNLKAKYKRIVESGGRFKESLDDLIKKEFKEGTSFKRRMEVASRPTWLISKANFLIMDEYEEPLMISGYEYQELKRKKNVTVNVITDLERLPAKEKNRRCKKLIKRFMDFVSNSYEWPCVGDMARANLVNTIELAIEKAEREEKYPYKFLYEEKLTFMNLLPSFVYSSDGFSFNYANEGEGKALYDYVGKDVYDFYEEAETFINKEYYEKGPEEFFEVWGKFIG